MMQGLMIGSIAEKEAAWAAANSSELYVRNGKSPNNMPRYPIPRALCDGEY
jgi:hypothetical protein